MDEDLFQVFIMFSILGSGIFAAACLFLRTNSERLNLHPIINCLLCIVNKRKNSMHPHIRVAKPFEFDPEEDMEKARRRLPMFDLNVNRKFHIFGHHTHTHHKKSHHQIAPHESIYSVPIRKITWAGHAIPRDQKHLLSPTLSPATEGASSPCSPSHFMHHDVNITSSSPSSECHKSERRRSMI